MRTVDVMSQAVGTFVKSDSLKNIRGITQDGKNGDLFVTADNALYRITYIQRTVKLISGTNSGYRDSTLLDSLFSGPLELILIKPNTLLIADSINNTLRLVHMNSDKVTTLKVTNSPSRPRSLLLTNNSLYVGWSGTVVQYKCEYNITIIQ